MFNKIKYRWGVLELIGEFKSPCKRTHYCWPTTPNIVGCYMLCPFAHPVACCWMLLLVVAQSLKPVKLFRQQLPTFLLFHDRRSVAQQCWIRLHSSSNIVGAGHAHNALFTMTYGLYPSHDALQIPTLLGVVASVCTPLLTRTQQLPTLLAQQCWKLLRPFACSLSNDYSSGNPVAPSLKILASFEIYLVYYPLNLSM